MFVTDSDGVGWSIWYDQGYRPDGWFSIHSETRLAPGAPVTALWSPDKSGQHLDLFGATEAGTVMSIWWDWGEVAGYRPGGWFTIHNETLTGAGGSIVALWKGNSHLDLFMIGADGTVKSIWFEAGVGYRSDGWFSIAPLIDSQFKPGNHLTVLWRNDRHLDFFAVAGRQTVWSTWFDTHYGYRPEGWFPIHPELKAQQYAPTSASWRGSDFLELFVTDPAGQTFTITYDANDPKDHPDGNSKFG